MRLWRSKRLDGNEHLSRMMTALDKIASAFDGLRSLNAHCEQSGTMLTDQTLLDHASAAVELLRIATIAADATANNFMRESEQFRIRGHKLDDYDVILLCSAGNAIKLACALAKEIRETSDPADQFLLLNFERPGAVVSNDRRKRLADVVESIECIRYASHRREYNSESGRYQYPPFLKDYIKQHTPSLIVENVSSFRAQYRI